MCHIRFKHTFLLYLLSTVSALIFLRLAINEVGSSSSCSSSSLLMLQYGFSRFVPCDVSGLAAVAVVTVEFFVFGLRSSPERKQKFMIFPVSIRT